MIPARTTIRLYPRIAYQGEFSQSATGRELSWTVGKPTSGPMRDLARNPEDLFKVRSNRPIAPREVGYSPPGRALQDDCIVMSKMLQLGYDYC